MTHPNRDLSILQHMVDYCNQIDETVAHFGNAYTTFFNSAVYRNATALCILQIGELVGKLTEEFKTQHPTIPWRQIKAMRNIVAHSYGTVDPETTWEIITDDIPSLQIFCLQILEQEQRLNEFAEMPSTATEEENEAEELERD